MDIEDLSKAQLLMLMLLVNFITSIATGVLTVSLLDQAPMNVTQTVNRIVDHTIETVASSTPLAAIVTPTPTTITKTVIENDDDLLPAAIAAAADRSVDIYASTGTSTALLGEGTYLPKARAIVTATSDSLPNDILVVFPDNSSAEASVSHAGASITIYGFADKTVLPNAPSPAIDPASSLKAGQAVVAITADGSAVTGIISKIGDTGVNTDLPIVPEGSSLVDINGDIAGISTGTAGQYFDADKITTLLTATTTPAS